jgi:tRNA A37 threonylcarbamoyltransferase TsaD
MNPLALPKRYYETERKPVHLVGYTLSLGMMAIGLVETLHGLSYTLRGEKGNLRLGIITLIAGGVAANEYLKEAGVDY